MVTAAGTTAPGTTAPDTTAPGTDGAGGPQTVACGFCGTEFVEDRSQATCQACPLSRACGLMRCPSCGYENPRSPRWISRIRKWVGG